MWQVLAAEAAKHVLPWAMNKISDWWSGSKKKQQPQQAAPSAGYTPGNAQMMGTAGREIQRSEKAPPAWLQGLYGQMAGGLQNLYADPRMGAQVYEGPRVAGLGESATSALSGLGAAAGGYSNPYLQSMLTSQMGSQANLANMAAGGLLRANPYFNEALQGALGMAGDEVTRQISGAGRYGSGAHTGALAQALGNIASQAQSSQYGQDIGSMLRANELIDQSRLGQLGAASQFLTGQSEAAQRQLAGGTYQDQRAQAALDAARQQWQEQQEAPFRRQQLFQELAKGLGGDYGVTRTSEPWSSAVMRGGSTLLANWDKASQMGESLGKLGGKLYDWWQGKTRQVPQFKTKMRLGVGLY